MMVYTFFGKRFISLTDKSASGGAVKSEIMSDQKLAEELRKLVISKFEN